MAAIFRDNGTSTNYTTVGANTTFGGNNGMFGVLGSSPSMHINFSGTAFVFEGTEKNLGATATVFQFFVRPAATATIGNGNTFFSVWDSAYSVSPIRIDFTHISGATYSFSLTDPSNSYASVTGSTVLTLGTAVRLVLYQTSAGWYLYLNNGTTPEVTYTHTQTTVGWQYVSVGTHYQNAAGSYLGVMDFGEFWIGNMNTAPTTAAQKAAEVWEGYKQNHIALSGQPYRNAADGSNASYTNGFIDTVSEGIAYAEVLAVQNNDQATFILVDNWTLANDLRSNSTTLNTNSNAVPTNFLNLMSFKYNSANTDGKGIATIYDANFATDADNERAQALLWAHAKWGSSANAVGSDLVAPNYKQRALNVIADLKTGFTSFGGNQYQWNDAFQSGTTLQMGGDYYNPAAFKLFAQYDTANTAFWNAAAAGTYDAHNKAAAVIFTGATPAQSTTSNLNPDWYAFNTTTGAVSTSPATYGDSDYGFNAFRIYNRLYDAYTWYADAAALTSLQKPKSFFAAEYTANSKIRATFKHDGTNTGNYQANIFNFSAYWVMVANDPSNTTGMSINSTNLTGLFSQQPYGSIISNTINNATQSYAYFDQSLNLRDYMRQNGLYSNYGQSSGVVSHNKLLLLGVG